MGTVTVSMRMSRPELKQLEHLAEDVGLDRSSFCATIRPMPVSCPL